MHFEALMVHAYFMIQTRWKKLKDVIQYNDNKGFAEDLTEGKFSFPIVHGVRADDQSKVVMSA